MTNRFTRFLVSGALGALLSVFLAVPLRADQTRGSYTNFCGSSRDTAIAGCTVTVTNHYTGALATLYSDNVGAGTALANPFTVGGTAKTFTFFVADGQYDVALSGTISGGFQFNAVVVGPTGNNLNNTITDFTPTVAGAAKLGTTALPFSDVVVGASANNTARIAGTFTGNLVMTIPDTASDTFVMRTATQTLTNKTFTAPALGAATATSINGIAITTGTGTLTITGAKTVTFNSTSTFTGTDAQTYTFPTTSATLARTDAANTFTGHQTIEGVTTTGATGTGQLVFDTAPTISGSILTTSTLTSPSITTDIRATTAGAPTLGTVAKPFGSAILGTAATNVLTITPAAFVAGSVATVDDPGIATAKLPLVKRGTISYTAGALTAGTCSAAQTATVTGLASTSVVYVNHNAAPGAQWQKGIYFLAYGTTNTVNFIVCNPTAGSITPDSATFNYIAFIP